MVQLMIRCQDPIKSNKKNDQVLSLIQHKNSVKQLDRRWAGVLVQWLWEETHVVKGVGSNPSTVYWMHIFHLYLLYKL